MGNEGLVAQLLQYLEVPQRCTADLTRIGTYRQLFTCAPHRVVARGAEHWVSKECAVSAERAPLQRHVWPCAPTREQ
jgi:hypothetical protein